MARVAVFVAGITANSVAPIHSTCQVRSVVGSPRVRSPSHARGAPWDARSCLSAGTACACQGCGGREWGLRPYPRATHHGTRVAYVGVAHHRQCLQGGGGAPGRRPHSRSPPRRAGTAVMTQMSIMCRDRSPRAWAGERGHRRRPAATTIAERMRSPAATELHFNGSRSHERSTPLRSTLRPATLLANDQRASPQRGGTSRSARPTRTR
jgi:hypothetical protein